MKCKHVNRLAHSRWSGLWIEEPYIRFRDAALIHCVDCCEVLPLGPSNDTLDVLVEIRAAQIVADGYMLWPEALAFHCEDDSEPTGPRRTSTSWHAGYLARRIVDHDSTPEAARDHLAEHRDHP